MKKKGDIVTSYKYLRGNYKVDVAKSTLVLPGTITRAQIAVWVEKKIPSGGWGSAALRQDA